ncbi:hypothetical protein ACFONC_11490 [Luteimonas soli]|uniref:DUF4124 domain-containing protein n=1 Tax=Luteimonas soli TaxID=1648966 RepID=A0ABV7XN79_9GAMM
MAAMLWPPPADAQIRRCTRPDGEVVFTDRACADVGGVARPKPSVHSPVYGGKTWARGCSRSLRDLIFEVTAAIDSRDVNRLAAVYNWTGMSSRNGYAVLGRLDVIANRPLIDVSAVLPAPQLSVDAGGGMTVSGAVDAQDYPGATVVRRRPVALRVEQVLSNGSTPSRTMFGLRRHMGCWWIVL